MLIISCTIKKLKKFESATVKTVDNPYFGITDKQKSHIFQWLFCILYTYCRFCNFVDFDINFVNRLATELQYLVWVLKGEYNSAPDRS